MNGVFEKLRNFHRTAVFWSFASAGLRVGAAILVLPLMLTRVPTEEMGVWYLMMTLANGLFLLDCGFAPSLSRAVAYAWAGARELVHFGVATNPDTAGTPNRELTAEVVGAMRMFYQGLAVVLALILMSIGVWVLPAWAVGAADYGKVQGVFVLFGLAVVLNALGSLWPGCLIGLNRVRETNQLYVAAKALNYAVSAGGLIAGWGLWALAVAYVLEGLLLRVGGRWLFQHFSGLNAYGWGRTRILGLLWPVAWRSGAVSGGAFLILQANLFVVGGRLGLAEAASYGLTIQVIMMLAAVSQAWFQVKLPLIAQWRVAGRIDQIQNLVVTRVRLVLLTYLVGAVGLVVVGPGLLQWMGSKTQLLPTGPLVLFLWILALEIHHAQFAQLVLSSNENPFLVPALLSGVLIVAGSWITAPYFGVWGVVGSTSLVQMAWNNWWTVKKGLESIQMSAGSYFLRLGVVAKS